VNVDALFSGFMVMILSVLTKSLLAWCCITEAYSVVEHHVQCSADASTVSSTSLRHRFAGNANERSWKKLRIKKLKR